MSAGKSSRHATKPCVGEIMDILHGMFPPDLAEEWDNVGLQVGDPQTRVQRIFVALDPTLKAVQQAAESGRSALVCHHPLIAPAPIKKIDFSSAQGKIIQLAAKRNVAIVAAHTNADWAWGGTADILAKKLGLKEIEPWQPLFSEHFRKLVVFVPETHLRTVSDAIFAAGGGVIGDYAKCSFRSSGEGTYLPLAGADPYAGRVGHMSIEPEARLEVRVPNAGIDGIIRAMVAAHPYKEVAYDIYPLEDQRPAGGRGRIGKLPRPLTLAGFARRAAKQLDCRTARFVGRPRMKVSQVIVSPGSGAFLLESLTDHAGTVLVTGDVKYHQAQQALDLGLAILDLGHYATELPWVNELTSLLGAEVRNRWSEVPVVACEPEGDPFISI